MIKIRKCALLNYSKDETPIIVGIYNVNPNDNGWRKCYKVQYDDGRIDYIPLSDVESRDYFIITAEEEV